MSDTQPQDTAQRIHAAREARHYQLGFGVGWQAAIEAAAQAACHWCKEDMELLHDESGYYHLYRGYMRNECRAAAIHALKEQTNA